MTNLEEATRLLGAARKIEGLTQDDAAELLGMTGASYNKRENNPGAFRVRELRTLAEQATGTARALILEAVRSIFLDLE